MYRNSDRDASERSFRFGKKWAAQAALATLYSPALRRKMTTPVVRGNHWP